MAEQKFDDVDDLAVRTIRVLSAETVQAANSGHPGAPIGMAALAHVLWSRIMVGNPKNPDWINRDRFVLSNGHACALQYCMLHLNGYPLSMQDLKDFRQLHSKTPGHPECHMTEGVEVSTGPLGQGIAQGVGLAIAQKHLAAVFNKDGFPLFDHKIYVFCGDGCLQEGVSSEASSIAGHLKLDNLVIIYDDNNITIDGKTELSFTENVCQRYEAYGFKTLKVENANTDLAAINKAIAEAKATKDAPVIIAAKTIIGFGTTKENTHGVHGSPLGAEGLTAFKKKMGLDPTKSFEVAGEIPKHYADTFAKRGGEAETQWNKLFASYCEKYPTEGATLKRLIAGELPKNWEECLPKYDGNSKKNATRSISGDVLNAIAPNVTELIGGAADLTPSTKTALKCSGDFQAKTPEGRYLRFGVREFAMFAIGNGISAYGGLIPFTSTFLNFITYGWGAVRLGALSQLRHLYIMTHDSIYLGEDGPTHQPVEVLPLLRATPNLLCMRPADGNEVAGAYAVGINYKKGPTVLCLSRQGVPPLAKSSRDSVSKGAYIVDGGDEKDNSPDVTFIATGSEVGTAVAAAALLRESKKTVRVVSAPCLELFDQQTAEYRRSVLGNKSVVVSVEASTPYGWTPYAHFSIGVPTFGLSAPASKVEEHFGLSPKQVCDSAAKAYDRLKDNAYLLPALAQ